MCYYTLADAQEMTLGCYEWHWMVGTEDYVWEVLNKRLLSFSLSYADLHSYGQFKHDIGIIKKITYCWCTSNCNAKNKTRQILMKLLFYKSSVRRWYEAFLGFISSILLSWPDICKLIQMREKSSWAIWDNWVHCFLWNFLCRTEIVW